MVEVDCPETVAFKGRVIAGDEKMMGLVGVPVEVGPDQWRWGNGYTLLGADLNDT
jgi:hypothetical protein